MIFPFDNSETLNFCHICCCKSNDDENEKSMKILLFFVLPCVCVTVFRESWTVVNKVIIIDIFKSRTTIVNAKNKRRKCCESSIQSASDWAHDTNHMFRRIDIRCVIWIVLNGLNSFCKLRIIVSTPVFFTFPPRSHSVKGNKYFKRCETNSFFHIIRDVCYYIVGAQSIDQHTMHQ